jgi:hypothetical protein
MIDFKDSHFEREAQWGVLTDRSVELRRRALIHQQRLFNQAAAGRPVDQLSRGEHARADYDVTVANQIATAVGIDVACHALQAAIVEYGDVSYDVITAGNRVNSHNMNVAAAAVTNRPLATFRPSNGSGTGARSSTAAQSGVR